VQGHPLAFRMVYVQHALEGLRSVHVVQMQLSVYISGRGAGGDGYKKTCQCYWRTSWSDLFV
jgi:hypothetical protein